MTWRADQRLPENLRGVWKHPQYDGPWRAIRITRAGLVMLRQDQTDGPPLFTTADPDELTEPFAAGDP